MQVKDLIIYLTSDNKERLIDFYRDVVELPVNPHVGEGGFFAGPATLSIDWHSETQGAAKEPNRVMLDFWVDDLRAEQARLEAQGVIFIRKEGTEFWGGTFSTFLDPDGNYCQLMQYSPE